MSDDRYQLIDFGGGRKLESLGGHLVDRPSPSADGARRRCPERWASADAVFDRATKTWKHHQPWPNDLAVDCGSFRMPLRPTPFGHIGLFPEQADNWRWLGTTVSESEEAYMANGLNLFGYTGASSMAMSSAGLSVVHVDAAKPNVQSAKQAAQLNRFDDRPIRYIVDDAAKFAAREVRRKRIYHTIVLDPPAYGHSPKGKAWRLERDLWPLLENCLEILDPDRFRLLITGHSEEVGATEVCKYLTQSRLIQQADQAGRLRIQSGRSQLEDSTGRSLDAGFFVRVERAG